jgi:hypothetical protein
MTRVIPVKHDPFIAERVLSRPDVQQWIAHPRAIIRDYDVPYLAGSSQDGGVTYVDRRIPAEIRVGERMIDPAKFLNVHEQVEHALMVVGRLPYEEAHKIATHFEHVAVTAAGVNWNEYEHVMDGYIDETEHEGEKTPPPDLYVKPYPHDKQTLFREQARREGRLEPVNHDPFG